MTQRLKRWESPRRQGRNDKGKRGSARARQLKKRQQMLRKKLQEGQQADDQNQNKGNQNKHKGRDSNSLPLFFGMIERSPIPIRPLAKVNIWL
jgi:hypothetical protein